MVHNIEAVYDQGVFRPVEPLVLTEGARVQLRVEEKCVEKDGGIEPPATEPAEDEFPTLLERMKDFVGTVHDLPPDASVNLDHYLYGTPKRQ